MPAKKNTRRNSPSPAQPDTTASAPDNIAPASDGIMPTDGTSSAVGDGIPANRNGARSANDTAPASGGVASAVWAALTAAPGSSIATLAATVGVSRTSVVNALTAFEADSKAARTRGARNGKQRTPDTWHAITGNDASDPAPEPEEPSAPTSEPTAPALDPAAPSADGPTDDPAHDAAIPEPAVSEPDPAEPPGSETDTDPATSDTHAATAAEAALEQATSIVTAMTSDTESFHAALADGDVNTAITCLDTIRASISHARRVLKTGTKTSTTRTGPILGTGQLRQMVHDHMAAHPGVPFSPYEVARVLGGRSSGAVANAMDRLVGDGHAVMVSESPRRYACPDANAA
jgi:hypothetical protein